MLLTMDTFWPDGDHFGLHFGGLGITWSRFWKALVSFWLRWGSQGSQMSYLQLLCRRERCLKEISWSLGPEGWRPVAACRGLANRLAACGSLWRLSGTLSEEDKIILDDKTHRFEDRPDPQFQLRRCPEGRIPRFQLPGCPGWLDYCPSLSLALRAGI